MSRKKPDYRGLKAASPHASAVGRGNRRSDTRPELLLRRSLWRHGLRYRLNNPALPGKPDLVFPGQQLAVFCDGDFWHGKDWGVRKEKLSKGKNAEYWVAKISRNMERDRRVDAELHSLGWRVVRVWESEIHANLEAVVALIEDSLRVRVEGSGPSTEIRIEQLGRPDLEREDER